MFIASLGHIVSKKEREKERERRKKERERGWERESKKERERKRRTLYPFFLRCCLNADKKVFVFFFLLQNMVQKRNDKNNAKNESSKLWKAQSKREWVIPQLSLQDQPKSKGDTKRQIYELPSLLFSLIQRQFGRPFTHGKKRVMYDLPILNEKKFRLLPFRLIISLYETVKVDACRS